MFLIRGYTTIGAHTGGGRNNGTLGIGLLGHFDLYPPGNFYVKKSLFKF